MSSKVTSTIPVMFASHGTPLSYCNESDSTDWWQKFGQRARSHGIKGLVLISSHWAATDDRVRVGTKLHPAILQMNVVPAQLYKNYPINISPDLGKRVVSLLKAGGISGACEDPDADWADDVLTPSRWMFPDGTPPATVVSTNARYDPIMHVKIGEALRPLATENILIVGSGAIVHNLWRANWLGLVLAGAKTSLQPGYKPQKWALKFERAVHDTINFNAGPRLPGALIRLLDHPLYKIAHPTDDHFYPLLVIAGVISGEEDKNNYGRKMAQSWDMGNCCSSQYLWGTWPGEN